jgi:hypothetical protein
MKDAQNSITKAPPVLEGLAVLHKLKFWILFNVHSQRIKYYKATLCVA